MLNVASSRLSLDRDGALLVVATSPASDVRLGHTFRVLGNDLVAGAPGFQWLGERTGRDPSTVERGKAAPYRSDPGLDPPAVDGELDDEAPPELRAAA